MFRRIIGIATAAALAMSAGLSGAAAAPHGGGHPGGGRPGGVHMGGVHMGGHPGGGYSGGRVHFAGRPGFRGGYGHVYRGGYGGGVPYGYGGYGYYPYGYAPYGYGYDDGYDAGPAIALGIIGAIGGIIASQGYYHHGCWWSHHHRVCR